MIWAGVQKIGCSSNSHGVKGCRYKAGDSKGCDTPNMFGCYDENVPEPSLSFSVCKEHVEACFDDSLEVSYASLYAVPGASGVTAAPAAPAAPAARVAIAPAAFGPTRGSRAMAVMALVSPLALAGLPLLAARRLLQRRASEQSEEGSLRGAEEARLSEGELSS